MEAFAALAGLAAFMAICLAFAWGVAILVKWMDDNLD